MKLVLATRHTVHKAELLADQGGAKLADPWVLTEVYSVLLLLQRLSHAAALQELGHLGLHKQRSDSEGASAYARDQKAKSTHSASTSVWPSRSSICPLTRTFRPFTWPTWVRMTTYWLANVGFLYLTSRLAVTPILLGRAKKACAGARSRELLLVFSLRACHAIDSLSVLRPRPTPSRAVLRE